MVRKWRGRGQGREGGANERRLRWVREGGNGEVKVIILIYAFPPSLHISSVGHQVWLSNLVKSHVHKDAFFFTSSHSPSNHFFFSLYYSLSLSSHLLRVSIIICARISLLSFFLFCSCLGRVSDSQSSFVLPVKCCGVLLSFHWLLFYILVHFFRIHVIGLFSPPGVCCQFVFFFFLLCLSLRALVPPPPAPPPLCLYFSSTKVLLHLSGSFMQGWQ